MRTALVFGLFVLLVLPCAAVAQDFQVRLVRSTDRSPVRGVRVQVDDQFALSDFTGTATLQFLEGAARHVRIQDLDFLHVDRDFTAEETKGLAEIALVPVEYGEVTLVAKLAGPAQPVPGAHVVLERQGTDFAPVRVESWTGFDGATRSSGLPTGAYRVVIEAEGCERYETTIDVVTGPQPLDAGLEPLEPTATVTGSLLDAREGTPIVGAAVEAMHPDGKSPIASVTSRADGRFELAGVPRGLRRTGTADAPIDPMPRRILLRVRAQGYLDGWFAAELDRTGRASVRASLWTSPGVVEEAEPNSGTAQAQLLSPTCTVRLKIDPVGDKDVFLIVLPSDGLLRLGVDKQAASLFYRVYSADATTLVAELGVVPGAGQPWEIGLRAGAWYVSVEEWYCDAVAGPLDLPIEFVPAPDPAERNDQAATAVDIGGGERIDGYLFPLGDVDAFRFPVATPGTGRFALAPFPATPFMRIRNDALSVLAERGGASSQECVIEWSLASPGTYYAEVEEWYRDQQSTTPYVVTLDLVPGDAGEAGTRNETHSTATSIEAGGFLSGTVNPIGDIDWYRFQVVESGMLLLRVAPMTVTPYVRVTDGSGTTLAERGGDRGAVLEMEVPLRARGTYYIGVEEWYRDQWTASPYLLRTSFRPNDPRDRRDNGALEASSPISPVARLEGRVAFPGDRDFYRLHLPARGVIRSRLAPWSQSPFLRCFGPEGKLVVEAGWVAEKEAVLEAHLRTPGWQVVSIEEWYNDQWGRDPYILTHVIDLEDPFEPNDSPEQATLLPSRTSVPFTSVPVADRDEYRFYADRKGRFHFVATSNGLTRYGRVFDAARATVVEGGCAAKDTLSLEWEVPAPGWYGLSVEEWYNDHWDPAHASVFAGPVDEPTPPAARLAVSQGEPRRKVSFHPSAEGPAAIASYEIDANGDGTYDWSSRSAEAWTCEYATGGWATAVLRVTDASGAVGYDFARFSTRDPREEGAMQVEILSPAAGALLDAPTEAEAIAWTLDGRPVESVEFLLDGARIGLSYTEPHRVRLDPTARAGKKATLVAVARGGGVEGRVEVPLAFPPVVNLAPADGALFTSTHVTFEWDTAAASSSEVVVTAADGTERTFDGEAGTHHRVEARGLEQGQEYRWVARSGEAASAPRTLRLVRGIEFVDRAYRFDVLRDYDQRGTIRVVNHSEAPERLRLHVESEQEDLLVGFVGDGSPDKVIELAPNEHRDLLLVVSAQDALQERYEFPITLEGIAAEGKETHTDRARVEVAVKMPRVEYEARILSQDPGTLACEIEVENRGDKVTDFSARLEGAEARAFLSPTMDHATLDAGGRVRFRVTPVLSESFAPFSARVRMRAIHVEKELEVSFAIPEGKRVFFVSIDPGQESRSDSWYCTNRPSIGSTVTTPNGGQIGRPVPGPPTPPIGQRSLRDIYEYLLEWIKFRALNPKHRKVLEAILGKHFYEVDGKIHGDYHAAIRELNENLRQAADNELSAWDKMWAGGGGGGKTENLDLSATWLSNLSNLATLAGPTAEKSKELAEAARKLQAEADMIKKIKDVTSVDQMKEIAEGWNNVLRRLGDLKSQAMFGPFKNPALATEINGQMVVLRAGIDNMNASVKKIADFQQRAMEAAKASANADPKGLEKFGTALNILSFAYGAMSRYETFKSQGMSDSDAMQTAVSSALTYQALTNIPLVALADLGETAIANLFGVGDWTLSSTIDALTVGSKAAGGALGEWGSDEEIKALLDALPQARVDATLKRLNEMIAGNRYKNEAQLRDWLRIRSLLQTVLAEKEKDP